MTETQKPELDEKLAREEKADRDFITHVLDWNKWIDVAHELFTASTVLGERVKAHYARWLEVSLEPQEDPEVVNRLWRHDDEKLFAVHNLLLAYTMENLLKALLVKRSNADLRERLRSQFEQRAAKRRKGELLRAGEVMRLPRVLFGKNHDLNELADAAKFGPLTSYDRWFFAKFGRWARWAARYPVPTSSRDMNDRKIDLNSDDPVATTKMITRICEAIQECPNPAGGGE
jgi:hypothetical protein